jgi:hypothetical protein
VTWFIESSLRVTSLWRCLFRFHDSSWRCASQPEEGKAYYLSTMVSFVMLLALVLLFLNQFVVVFNLVALTAIPSLAGLPKLLNVQERELAKRLQEVDLSAPLTVGDFLTWKGWLKLASRRRIHKTMCLYFVFMMGVGGAILFTLSIFGIVPTLWAACYIIIVGIVSTIIPYHQIEKALEKSSLEH